MKVWTDEVGINVAWKQSGTTTAIRLMRITRVVLFVATLGAIWLAATTSSGPLVVVFSLAWLVLAVAFAVMVVPIAKARERLRPRPSYSLIASMERPIWGEAFEHAGAPGLGASGIIGTPSPRLITRPTCLCCGAPRPVARERCADCYREWGRRYPGER
jgi:hypothetical protein